MSARKKRKKSPRTEVGYRRIRHLIEAGALDKAEAALRHLLSQLTGDGETRALCHNDLAVLLALRGATPEAGEHLRLALAANPNCESAQVNLTRMEREGAVAAIDCGSPAPGRPLKVALVSLLFDRLSSVAGGGCVHTAGLAEALAADGNEVRHFYARCSAIGAGEVIGAPFPFDSEAIDFDDDSWRRPTIQERFRERVDRFWAEVDGSFHQCPYHQLARPEVCRACLEQRGGASSALHQAERAVSGAGESDYPDLLHRTLNEADAVLVNNPLIQEALSPYASQVCVIPPGVDPARFPEADGAAHDGEPDHPMVVFMAGVVEERSKGFSTLHEACAKLWQKRQDFRLVATGVRSGPVDEFTSFTGWLSQEELPEHYRKADICVVPSWVQESWSLVGVEAMAAGRPVVASSIGGLQFLVSHGATGLLCRPGDARGLRDCLDQLLDDPDQRRQMGRQARRQFELTGSWDAIISQHYRPLLAGVREHHSS